MNRREFTALAGVLAATVATSKTALTQQADQAHTPTEAEIDHAMQSAMAAGPRRQIAMLVYPAFTALDLIGPHTFLSALMNADVHLVWKTKDPVPLDRGGTALLPTTTLDECPKDLDVLFVPGGLQGTTAVIKDDAVLDFLSDRGSRAKFVTSVCTGSLVLGCAGLLKGYRATSHWLTRDYLPIVGAIPVAERVVEDRNRLTGAGVSAGIDFGLALTAKLTDKTYAEMLQLINEYDPQPPFHAGSPAQAGAPMVAHLREFLAPANEELMKTVENARKRRAI